MEACKESGHGLVLEGQFWKFDEDGNKKALAFLEVTDMKSHVRVKVTGYFVPWSSEFSYSSAGMAMVERIEAVAQ